MDPVIRDQIFRVINRIYRGDPVIPGDDNFMYS